MIPTTLFLSGSAPVIRDGAEVPVLYTLMPPNVKAGDFVYVGDDKLEVTSVEHMLSHDGSSYVRTLIYCKRDAPPKVKVAQLKPRKLKLTPRKI